MTSCSLLGLGERLKQRSDVATLNENQKLQTVASGHICQVRNILPHEEQLGEHKQRLPPPLQLASKEIDTAPFKHLTAPSRDGTINPNW